MFKFTALRHLLQGFFKGCQLWKPQSGGERPTRTLCAPRPLVTHGQTTEWATAVKKGTNGKEKLNPKEKGVDGSHLPKSHSC